MRIDHYAGAAQRWAECASLVYGPIAHQLLDTSPHGLRGRVVLDAGAGTGIASAGLVERGARPLAIDLSFDMLIWDALRRPPATVADVARLPLRADSVDDVVAAFVYNHLTRPGDAIVEARRVTRRHGAVLACVFANASRNEARDAVDQAARAEGWEVPAWYLEVKRLATPLLGTAEDMARAARGAGLVEMVVDERPVDVGITEADQLVDYRLGQAQFSSWLDSLGSERVAEVRRLLAERARPVMRPYRPIVVFLAALVP